MQPALRRRRADGASGFGRLQPQRSRRPSRRHGSGANAVALPAPTTMDQVVDRFIEREHGLMKALSNRTPVVETYLQNLTADPQLGPVPSGDHYFLGRMDMGETGRPQGLSEGTGQEQRHAGHETRLLGGFHKLYKVQYQPTGFSWMVYADRTDFDRAHYDFHYIRREFLGDIRCLVFDVTPKKSQDPAEDASSAASGWKTRTSTSSASTELILRRRAIPTSSTWIAGA